MKHGNSEWPHMPGDGLGFGLTHYDESLRTSEMVFSGKASTPPESEVVFNLDSTELVDLYDPYGNTIWPTYLWESCDGDSREEVV